MRLKVIRPGFEFEGRTSESLVGAYAAVDGTGSAGGEDRATVECDVLAVVVWEADESSGRDRDVQFNASPSWAHALAILPKLDW